MMEISKLRDQVITRGHNHSWEVDEKGKFRLSLGNMTDAGWFWDGNEKDMVGFLIRLAKSTETDNFLNGVKGKVDFKDIKSVLLEALKKNDGLYEVSGDNRVWHFGESFEPDESADRDYLIEKKKLPKEKAEKIIQDAYDYYKTDYDEFEKQYGSVYNKEMKKIIEDSTSFEDFINKIKSEDFTMTWAENLMEYTDQKWRKALSQSMGRSKKQLKRVI